jgi:hypothetical protein
MQMKQCFIMVEYQLSRKFIQKKKLYLVIKYKKKQGNALAGQELSFI